MRPSPGSGARHEEALGGLFSQVLRLLADEGMVSLGLLSLDGTKLADNAAQEASKTLPQTGKLLAEAAAADAAEDARQGEAEPVTPQPRNVCGLPGGHWASRAPTATTPAAG